MKNIFRLTITTVKYPHKADWSKAENIDVFNNSYKELAFYAYSYNEIIERLFKTEIEKSSKLHGNLVQAWIDLSEDKELYNLDEFVDYVEFRNSDENSEFDFEIVGRISVFKSNSNFSLPIEIPYNELLCNVLNNEFSTQFSGTYISAEFKNKEEVAIFEQDNSDGQENNTWMSWESNKELFNTFPVKVVCKFIPNFLANSYTAVYYSVDEFKKHLTDTISKL